jgi:urease accessory protein
MRKSPMKPVRRIAAAGLIAGAWSLLAIAPALAHPGHDSMTLAAGLLHPLSGADHILAMTAVGLLAAKRGGAALITWPCAFIAAMLAGYAAGLAHRVSFSVEPGILASVIVLGALAASSVSAPLAAGLGLIGLFGLCHGYAHGAEAPAGAGIGFPIGFAVSTAALHGLGLALGAGALRLRHPMLLRVLGGGVALGGVALVLAS